MQSVATPELRTLVRQLEDAIDQGIDETRAWLASEEGRRYRAIAARALVLAAPLILRHPVFKTPVGRLVGLAGGTALVIKVADMIRDWEPTVPSAIASR